jgi:hypothetical protein
MGRRCAGVIEDPSHANRKSKKSAEAGSLKRGELMAFDCRWLYSRISGFLTAMPLLLRSRNALIAPAVGVGRDRRSEL